MMVIMMKVMLTTKVMPPQRPNLVLATDIPNVELDVFISHSFDVEADGRDGSNILSQF